MPNGPYDIAGNWQPLGPSFAVFQLLSSPPLTSSKGRSYFDTSLGEIGVYTGSTWAYVGGGGGGGGNITSVFGRTGVITGQAGDYSGVYLPVPTGSTAQYVRGDGTLTTFPTNLSSFTNGPGYLTTITSSQVTTALGYTPVSPVGSALQYIKGDGTFATFPTNVSTFTNDSGYLTSASSLAWAKVTGTPTTVAGYSISDAVTITGAQTLSNKTITGYQQTITLTTTGSSGAATLIGNTLNVPQYTGGGGSTLTRQSVTTAGSVTGTTGNLLVTINLSVANSIAFTMPASPTDQQVVCFEAGGTITTGNVVTVLTVTANSGQSLIQAQAPTTMNAGEYIQYRYNTSLTAWFREI